MKRGADRQITKDDAPEDDGTGEEGGTWKEASADKIAARKIIKVKRKGTTGGDGEAGAGFNFGGAAQPAAGSFNFNFGGGAAAPAPAEEKKEEEKKEAAPAAAAPAAPNAFAALLNKSDWECKACMVSNKESDTKCRACETPKEGAAAAPTEAGFGNVTASGFNVGGAAAGAFSFGATAPAWGGAFGAGAKSEGAALFGGTSSGVTFGSVGSTGVTFGSSSATPTKFEATTKFGANGDPTNEAFKDKKAEASGTEDDKTIFKIQCKAFQLRNLDNKKEETTAKKTKFVECGEGEMRVNTVHTDGENIARVILRADKTQRLVLNAPLFKGMTLLLQGEKFVKFASNDPGGKPAVYLIKVKNKSESTLTMKKMEEAVATLK